MAAFGTKSFERAFPQHSSVVSERGCSAGFIRFLAVQEQVAICQYAFAAPLLIRGIQPAEMDTALSSAFEPDVAADLKFSITPGQLTAPMLHMLGFREPLLVKSADSKHTAAQDMGMQLPEQLTLEKLADAVGQWLNYMTKASEDRTGPLLNVLGLQICRTRAKGLITAPAAVRALDLVNTAWPKGEQDSRPEEIVVVLSSPAGAVTDWHIDFGGSCAWYHVISGSKTFVLAPPTPHNLRAFELWACPSDAQSGVDFSKTAEGLVRVTVNGGESLLIPSAWLHTVLTATNTLMAGGHFLHALALRQHVAIWEMEDRMGTPMQARYPSFQPLMTHAAAQLFQQLCSGPSAQSAQIMNGLRAMEPLLGRWREERAMPPSINAASLLEGIRDALKQQPPPEKSTTPIRDLQSRLQEHAANDSAEGKQEAAEAAAQQLCQEISRPAASGTRNDLDLEGLGLEMVTELPDLQGNMLQSAVDVSMPDQEEVDPSHFDISALGHDDQDLAPSFMEELPHHDQVAHQGNKQQQAQHRQRPLKPSALKLPASKGSKSIGRQKTKAAGPGDRKRATARRQIVSEGSSDDGAASTQDEASISSSDTDSDASETIWSPMTTKQQAADKSPKRRRLTKQAPRKSQKAAPMQQSPNGRPPTNNSKDPRRSDNTAPSALQLRRLGSTGNASGASGRGRTGADQGFAKAGASRAQSREEVSAEQKARMQQQEVLALVAELRREQALRNQVNKRQINLDDAGARVAARVTELRQQIAILLKRHADECGMGDHSAAPAGLKASPSKIYTARSWHPGNLLDSCIFYLDTTSGVLQGPYKVGHIRLLLKEGVLSDNTLLLHSTLGMAPLQQALLTQHSPSMVPTTATGQGAQSREFAGQPASLTFQQGSPDAPSVPVHRSASRRWRSRSPRRSSDPSVHMSERSRGDRNDSAEPGHNRPGEQVKGSGRSRSPRRSTGTDGRRRDRAWSRDRGSSYPTRSDKPKPTSPLLRPKSAQAERAEDRDTREAEAIKRRRQREEQAKVDSAWSERRERWAASMAAAAKEQMAELMAELQASAEYEGLWSFMDVRGHEQGPFTVKELQSALHRKDLGLATMVHDEEDGVSLRLKTLLARYQKPKAAAEREPSPPASTVTESAMYTPELPDPVARHTDTGDTNMSPQYSPKLYPGKVGGVAAWEAAGAKALGSPKGPGSEEQPYSSTASSFRTAGTLAGAEGREAAAMDESA
ncbi:hypothetical protein WJX73_009824 [Symbiochloris irregularis]|uniref:JmjC domain-containing protein n=1 Tax=Symbiochloris irregularis TaxID=706552 RepID=A0AAW1PT85_9CHLO